MIHVLLADNHTLFRAGVCALFASEEDIQVIAEAADENMLEERIREREANVLLIDADFGARVGRGVEATRKTRVACPGIGIVGFSRMDGKGSAIDMLKAGANGFLLSDAQPDDMLTAIRLVASGDSYLPHEVSLLLLHQLTPGSEGHATIHAGEVLTARETEVLQLIAEEYSNPEIAEKLFIGLRTVDTHRRHLLEKLGAKNTAGLVKYALRQGII